MSKYDEFSSLKNPGRPVLVEAAKRDGSGKNIENNYAKQNGSYETLHAGSATSAKSIDNLSRDSGSTQDDPFIAQGTGTNNNTSEVSTSPVAKQLEKQGNTIVRNQYAKELNATNWTAGGNGSYDNGVATFQATIQYGSLTQNTTLPLVSGHKYLLKAKVKMPSAGYQARLTVGDVSVWYREGVVINLSSINDTNWHDVAIVGTYTRVGSSYQKIFLIDMSTSDFGSIQITDIEVTDLDQWNLSSDVITRLTSHPEEWLNYDCTDDSYNTGTIKNANGVTLVTIKKNIWDEVTETGGIIGGVLNSKNFIRVLPNKNYVFKSPYACGVVFYDKDKQEIRRGVTNAQTAFTIPSNCIWIKFYISSDYGTTYKNDISLYLVYWKDNDDHSQGMDGDHYNTYLPFEKHEYNIGSETLLAFDKKLPTGLIEHNTYEKTFTGSESWSFDSNDNYWYCNLGSSNGKNNNAGGKQITSNGINTVIVNNELIRCYLSNNPQLTSESNMNTVFPSGSKMQYELKDESKTTEQGTSFPENIEVDDYGMMYWLDGDGNFVTTPQGCKFFYPADYVLLIDDLNNYTNGDVEALAKKSDLSDLVSQVNLSEQITDVAGLTYSKKKAIKTGNLVTLTIVATNNTESAIPSNTTLFQLSNSLTPSVALYPIVLVHSTIAYSTINNANGNVSVNAELGTGKAVYIDICYCL